MSMFKGWRTIAVNVALSILPIVELAEFRDVLPDDWLKWYALIIVLANMWLRTVTTTAMGRKE